MAKVVASTATQSTPKWRLAATSDIVDRNASRHAVNVASGPAYSVVDATTGATVPVTSSTSGTSTTLSFGGVTLSLDGAPAAGDSFNAGYLAAVARGADLTDALTDGTALASRAISTFPRQYGLPDTTGAA